MYLQIFNVVGPVFIMTFIGFILARRFPELDSRTLSTCVLMVATPALVFSTLTSLEVTAASLAKMAFAAALGVGVAGLIAWAILLIIRFPVSTFLPSLMLPNSGNIGLPVVLLAFGEAGLALAISYFFVVALLQYTVGAAIASGQYRLGELVRQPLVWSILAVLLVMATGFQVPQVIETSTAILGGMMVPAMLILLGTSLSRLKVADLKPALLMALLRLMIGASVGFGLTWALGLHGVEAGTVFLLAVMPTAIINYVLADRYRDDAQQVAGVVVVSTLITFALLPGLILVAYWFAGQSGN